MSSSEGTFPVYLSTTFDPPPGWRVTQTTGLAFGLVVRSIGLAKGITGSIRALRAGEVTEYTQTLEDSRRHALDRLVEHARAMGANVILGVRFDSSEVGQGLQEILAYGTGAVMVQG
jgi:uncharacterized protein YbjQ (UPF0145 family)